MNRIAIRNNKFCIVPPSGEIVSSDSTFIDVVIINKTKVPSRMYYSEGKHQCWSTSGVKPDIEVNNQQNKTCLGCSKNISGSGEGMSRACRFQKQLAILLANNIMEGEIYQLIITSISIFGKASGNKMPFDAYSKYMKAHKVDLEHVVTEIRLDEDNELPKLLFFPKRPLDVHEYQLCQEKSKEKKSIDATKIHFISHKGNFSEEDLILNNSGNFSYLMQAMGMTADIKQR